MKSETKAYVELLRYGLKNQGILYQDALKYLNDNSISFHDSALSQHDTLLQRHFRIAFESFSGDPFSINNHSERYYIKFEAMSFLASYESIESAKSDAKQARKVALWSLWLTGIVAIASIFIQIVFQ